MTDPAKPIGELLAASRECAEACFDAAREAIWLVRDDISRTGKQRIVDAMAPRIAGFLSSFLEAKAEEMVKVCEVKINYLRAIEVADAMEGNAAYAIDQGVACINDIIKFALRAVGKGEKHGA